MRLGVIDLGTNSARLDIFHLTPSKKVIRVRREKDMIRLGRSVFLTRRLDRHAIERALRVLQKYRKICDASGTQQIIAVATSALREAQNTPQFVKQVFRRTGIRLTVISGQREARLTACGVLQSRPKIHGLFGTVDIGGGSTEVNICRGSRILRSMSMPLGAARLQHMFLEKGAFGSLSRQQSGDALRAHVRTVLRRRFRGSQKHKLSQLLGSSGTVRCYGLLAMAAAQKKRTIPAKFLSEIVPEMLNMTEAQLRRVPGMDKKRVDLIVAGGLILDEVVCFFETSRVIVCEYSLRDGLFQEELRKFQEGMFKRKK